MKKKENRRSFLKTSVLLGGGAALAQSCLPKACAQEKQADSSKYPNETIKTIQNLRTIHGNFIDKEIPDETIELILQSSIRAANASNTQAYSIVVVKDRKKIQQVCTYQGSCMLLYCVDRTRMIASAESLGQTFYPDNMGYFVTDCVSTSLAVQTAVIAARSLGIDSLITNGIHRGDMQRVWDILDLPEKYCYPLIALVLGYPTQEPDHKMGRLDGAGIIHREKYHRLTKEQVEEITRKYDDKDQHLVLDFGRNWEQQGHKHYLDWYFKSWAGGSKPTDKETPIFTHLKKSGFVDLQKT
jgi:nitroreductase